MLHATQIMDYLSLLIIFIASRVPLKVFMQNPKAPEEMEAAFGQQLRDLRLRRNID